MMLFAAICAGLFALILLCCFGVCISSCMERCNKNKIDPKTAKADDMKALKEFQLNKGD